MAGKGWGREEAMRVRAVVREVGEGGVSMSAGGVSWGRMRGGRGGGGRAYKGGIQRFLLLLGTLRGMCGAILALLGI